MFVYHYVIIPFHSQYLRKHAPLTLQSGGIQSGGIGCVERLKFTLLSSTSRMCFAFANTVVKSGNSAHALTKDFFLLPPTPEVSSQPGAT